MDLGFVLRTWFNTLRYQRLLWKMTAVLLIVYLPMTFLGTALEASPLFLDNPDDALTWVLVFVGSIVTVILLIFIVSLVVSVSVIYVTREAYPSPQEKQVTWAQIRPYLGKGVLRSVAFSLLMGLVALGVLILFLGLPFMLMAGGFAALETLWTTPPEEMMELLSVGAAVFVIGFLWLLCILIPLVFLLAPFVQAASIGVIVEWDTPFWEALRHGFRLARKKYGWWLLTIIGVMALAAVITAFSLPFDLLAGALNTITQEMGAPFVLYLVANFFAQVVSTFLGAIQVPITLALYTVVYLHLQERLAPSSSSIAPEHMPSEPMAPSPSPTDFQATSTEPGEETTTQGNEESS